MNRVGDWRRPDARLAALREAKVSPIVGLVHHGSGPRHTSLLDDAVPAQLAAYAGAVAARYPWVTRYTPINEPLTTARFSALYGHWYPHARDDLSFARALVQQCKATVLAMRAIREVQSDAQLFTTDVEAVRAVGLTGIEHLLDEAWQRFGLPLAVTEVHLGCTRDEQLRWLVHIHDAGRRARAAGVAVTAITAWAMFGAFDWASLGTRDDGQYESGLFDVRSPAPRATALAHAVRSLAAGVRPIHAVLAAEGWWARTARADERAA